MTENTFQPVVYLKAKCPFCMKVRIFLLESGLKDRVEVRNFEPGTDEEKSVRAEVEPHLEKVSFPAAQVAPGEFMADSDGIISRLGADLGIDPQRLGVLQDYVAGPFQRLMQLFRENMELKKQQA